MGPDVTSGLCMNGMNKPPTTVDTVRSERVKNDIIIDIQHSTVGSFEKMKIKHNS